VPLTARSAPLGRNARVACGHAASYARRWARGAANLTGLNLVRDVLLGVLLALWTAWWISLLVVLRAKNKQLPPFPRRGEVRLPARLSTASPVWVLAGSPGANRPEVTARRVTPSEEQSDFGMTGYGGTCPQPGCRCPSLEDPLIRERAVQPGASQLPESEPVISIAGVVPTGLVVMSSPRGANTARIALAIAYGTLSADQKPRSVSGDNAPPITRNRIPSGAASNRNRPAQRTPVPHRLRTNACPSSIEATIKIENAIRNIVWPMSLSLPRAVTV
jgi:hypothetical protein